MLFASQKATQRNLKLKAFLSNIVNLKCEINTIYMHSINSKL